MNDNNKDTLLGWLFIIAIILGIICTLYGCEGEHTDPAPIEEDSTWCYITFEYADSLQNL